MSEYINIHNLNIINAELTNYCNASCPMCPRFDFDLNLIKSITNNSHTTLETIKNSIGPKVLSQLKRFYSCGVLGDGSMNPECLEIYEYVKRCGNSHLSLNTNGGARTTDFWKELAKLNVEVTFSIDGLEDTNHLYRRNVKWDRVIENVQAFINAGGKAEWDFLTFKHNQHQIEEAEILSKKLADYFYKKQERPGTHDEIQGLNNVDKMINIDQSPIGRTPRSNPATYTGLFTPIRELFASMPEAKSRGYKPGRFSFNVKGGRCETCGGAGYLQIEMQFLPDVTVPCELCLGARYNREALEIKFKNKSISEVLDMTVSEATEHFNNIPPIQKTLQTLTNVGLGYIKLGQPATTLSGGEAQRIKLAAELSKRSTDSTLYILDEPTTGLSFDDVAKLLFVLQRLIDKGNTVILIEHHLDLIKSADWIIDLGPKAGAQGGSIIAQGTPEYIASVKNSDTGKYLSKMPNIVSNKKANGTVKSLLTPKLTIVGNQISPLKLLSKRPTLISPKSRSSKKHWRRRKKSIIQTGV